MSDRNVIVGVDVGGTFTDLFLLDAANGRFRTAKVPSRRGDESQGFLNGLNAFGGAGTLHSIVHGTTVGTNTLLERRGPKIGVIATRAGLTLAAPVLLPGVARVVELVAIELDGQVVVGPAAVDASAAHTGVGHRERQVLVA